MRFRIDCSVHACPVIPAGEELHFLPIGEPAKILDSEVTTVWSGKYELDWADLYCAGGTGVHKFFITVIDGTTGSGVLMVDDDDSVLCINDHTS